MTPHGLMGWQLSSDTRAIEREQLRSRIDSLVPVLIRAARHADAVRNAKAEALLNRSVPGTDTIRVGPLNVIVVEGRGDRARPYFEQAWELYSPMLDGRAPRALETHLFAFQEGSTARQLALAPSVSSVFVRPWTRRRTVEEKVRAAVESALHASLPGPQSWLLGRGSLARPVELETVYREMATGMSPTLSRCASGHLGSCWAAVGVTQTHDPTDRVRSWYTEDQRRTIVQANARARLFSSNCAGDDIQVCDALLADKWESLVPLGFAGRSSLAVLAIEMGGDGAFHRFAAPLPTPADYRDLIARTAGTSADHVMTEWHRRVVAAKPNRPRTEREARFGALFWILFFVALSSRSTRWRLG
jgi:hypothetical protein